MSDLREEIINEIVEEFSLFKRYFKRQAGHGKNLPPVPPAQAELLHIVASRGPLTVKEIAEQMRVTGSAVTQFADGLVEAGLITREHDGADRRTVNINLSPAGRAKIEGYERHRREHMEAMLKPLTVEELKTYRDIHRKIVAGLNTDKES
jgi:MarR family transcriptional regulator, organic hydroperoxide resistance regulator